LFDGLAGAVVLDPIVAVRRLPFSGHVYNLHTETGWYIASGILVHNCRCSTAPAGTI
jgi:intein/homing endonuclease